MEFQLGVHWYGLVLAGGQKWGNRRTAIGARAQHEVILLVMAMDSRPVAEPIMDASCIMTIINHGHDPCQSAGNKLATTQLGVTVTHGQRDLIGMVA
jgi:hypothetical protein